MKKTLRSSHNKHSINLHGIKHQDAELVVENHVLLHEPPLDVITGNSTAMQKIVIKVLKKHDFKFMVGDGHNQGYIKVLS